MKKRLFTGIFLLSTLFYSCTDNPVAPAFVGNGYFPLSLGLNWTYDNRHSSVYNGEIIPSRISVIAEVKLVNGINYMEKRQERFSFQDTALFINYYRRSNDTIFEGITDWLYPDTVTENITLIERIGATWSSRIAAMPHPYIVNYTVTDKGLLYTVNGIEYKDVLRIHVTATSTDINGKIFKSEGNFYYAKNIGLIEDESSSGNLYKSSRLKSYFIK